MAESVNVRDHLANERTFLAWVRTSISLLGFGVRSTLLGLAFVTTGHYARTWRMIDGGDYRPAPHLIFAFSGLIIGLGLASVLYLLSVLR